MILYKLLTNKNKILNIDNKMNIDKINNNRLIEII